VVNYPTLLAPSRLAPVGHSLRVGLCRNDVVPRPPCVGVARLSLAVPRVGRGLSGPPSTVRVDCPAGLIPGVLALYPQAGDGSRTRSRSSFPSTGRVGIAPQEPVYWWLLPSPACARATVCHKWGTESLSLVVVQGHVGFLSGLLAPSGRSLRPEAPPRNKPISTPRTYEGFSYPLRYHDTLARWITITSPVPTGDPSTSAANWGYSLPPPNLCHGVT